MSASGEREKMTEAKRSNPTKSGDTRRVVSQLFFASYAMRL